MIHAYAREHTLAQIRHRRALGLAKPRRRIPRQLRPVGIQLGYFQALRPMLAAMRGEVERLIVPRLAEWVETAARQRGDSAEPGPALVFDDATYIRTGVWSTGETPSARDRFTLTRLDSAISAKDAIDKAVEAFNQRQEAHGAVLSQIADRTARRTSDFQAAQLSRQVRAALGVELPPQDVGLHQRIAEFTTVNVALIKSIPATYFGQVEAVVLHGVSSGRRHEDIADDLVRRGIVAEDRAALVARDQVGKFYGRLNEARQVAIGVTSFVWRTVHDNRVREEHAGYDGQTFEWANPPEDGIPGEPVNCRCNADPIFDGVLSALNGE